MKTPPTSAPTTPALARAHDSSRSPTNHGVARAEPTAPSHIPTTLAPAQITVENAANILLGMRNEPLVVQPITCVPASLEPVTKTIPLAAPSQGTSANFLKRLLHTEGENADNARQGRTMQHSSPLGEPSSPRTMHPAKRHKGNDGSPRAATSAPHFFEKQGPGTLTCLQQAFNNAWQAHAWELPSTEASHGADLDLVCTGDGLGERKMMRLEIDKDQLAALKPLLLDELERMVIYRGTVTIDSGVQGHYIALLKQDDRWYLLDSLKECPVQMDAAKYLDACLSEGTTLLATVPEQSSQRVRSIVTNLSQGAFPYACRLLGKLYGTQPIEELASHLEAQASSDVRLSASSLSTYLAARGQNASHQAWTAVGSDSQDLENVLNEQLPQHAQGLLWVRTAPYLIAVRRHNDGWQTLMQDLQSNDAAFISQTPATLWSALQGKFNEMHEAAGDVRKAEIQSDRRAVDFISLDSDFSARWPEAASVESLSQGQVHDSKVGEVRLVKASRPYYAAMEFDSTGTLRCAAFHFEKATGKSGKAEAKLNAEKRAEAAMAEIRNGGFNFETHREKLWELNGGNAFSACPGVSYNSSTKRWQLDFGTLKLGEKKTWTSRRLLLKSLQVQHSPGSEVTREDIMNTQRIIESYWGDMMTRQISREQWNEELAHKNYPVRKPAEHHSNVPFVDWDKTHTSWVVSYFESPKKGSIKVGKTRNFHAKSNEQKDIDAALENAKDFASGVELGRYPKKQSSTKKTRKK
ncbi:hypothetical protein [Noviherbaspirillum malthae]|uniref:hypothetical protein n=1 Tax=Noviherbaspirillum malthae TaxID=1260987 RepID=UPI00188E792A|nr:hypothetical protein [Noviherbaspirillum malthae]